MSFNLVVKNRDAIGMQRDLISRVRYPCGRYRHIFAPQGDTIVKHSEAKEKRLYLERLRIINS